MTSIRLLGALALSAVLTQGMLDRVSAQQSTTASYDDWVVHCVSKANKPPQKVCDMEQTTQVRGRSAPLSRVAIAPSQQGHPAKLVAQLPVNLWLPSGVKLFLNGKDKGIAGRFLRCVPGSCFAEIDLTDAQVRAFRTEKKPGRLIFKNADGHEIAIPVSFRGFAQAFDALVKD